MPIGLLAADESKTMVVTRDAVHVATALNHITVFEFGEPVSSAAVGSGAFQVEWRESRVYVKPLRAGASTDLFVWTASRRFTYELDPPGEVKDMNFVVENSAPESTTVARPVEQSKELVDGLQARTMLDLMPIDHSRIKDVKHGITVRIEGVFLSNGILYIRYSALNLGGSPYRLLNPQVVLISAERPRVSLTRLERTQLDPARFRKLAKVSYQSLPVLRGETKEVDLKPGTRTDGIVAASASLNSMTPLELYFGPYGKQPVTAAFVF